MLIFLVLTAMQINLNNYIIIDSSLILTLKPFKMKKVLLVIVLISFATHFAIAQNEIISKYSSVFEWIIKPKYDMLFVSEGNIFTVQKKGKFGYIDLKDNIIVPLDYGFATVMDAYGFAVIGKSATDWKRFIDLKKNGSIAFDNKFQHAFRFVQGYAVVATPGTPKFGIIDTLGNFVIPYTYGLIVGSC